MFGTCLLVRVSELGETLGVGGGELVFESGEAPGRPGGVGCLSTIGVFALRS